MRVVVIMVGLLFVSSASAQMERAHMAAARSTVRIHVLADAAGNVIQGAGWVTRLAGHEVIVTNRHVVGLATHVNIKYFDHSESSGRVLYRSATADVAVVLPLGDVPVPPLPFVRQQPRRGQRMVVCGHPPLLFWVCTEGIVAGAVRAAEPPTRCGSQSCLVLDAESDHGNSGGPVVNARGHVVGMLWGALPGTSLSLVIHSSALSNDLDGLERQLLEWQRTATQTHQHH